MTEEVTAEAGRDRLTGLLTRQSALQRLDALLAKRGGDSPPSLHCLLIGISQFASVNTAFGVGVADELLARGAARLHGCMVAAQIDCPVVARMGGTEFLIAYAAPDEKDGDRLSAPDLARLLLTSLSRPFITDGKVIRLTARCGISDAMDGDDAASLVRRANAALEDARRSGVSDISVRRTGISESGYDHDRLDADLRHAIDRGEITIVYQPQYDCNTNIMVGVEALARWQHPQFGLLDAGMLFAAAERCDYLLPLSQHIQRAALDEAGRWPSHLSGLRVSVNMTAADLARDRFVMGLLETVARSGFPPGRLTVEITESGLVENIDRAAQLLQELRSLGIRVALDDFGTGYSSLAYLKALETDYLKIDHGLSCDIVGSTRDRVIVRSIIGMARALGMTVIAEGVETEQQLRMLTCEGCEIYQGFLRSPAVTSDQLAELFEGA